MTLPIICISNLSKRYLVGHEQSRERNSSLRDTIARQARVFARKTRDMLHGRQIVQGDEVEEFWALKDVSFDVQPGEVVGIIGRNGAGKSTLLKILSRITEPTEGRVTLRGRVASLLEVGTGFHAELTGRENVYLNGAILGMSQVEIRKKFDEIIAFAGVEKFLDTPVKRYSSGMYVRLAFAVAAHLEPEILLVDEVLAVGDMEFQKKCLGKMDEVSKSGRTVLFVSHNMAAIEALCSRSVLLEDGCIRGAGLTPEIIGCYQGSSLRVADAMVSLEDHPGRPPGRPMIMWRVTMTDDGGRVTRVIRPGSSVTITVDYAGLERPIMPVLGLIVKTASQVPVFGIDNRIVPGYGFPESDRAGAISCKIYDLPLLPGLYPVDLYLGDSQRSIDQVCNAVALEIPEMDLFGSGRLPTSNCGPVVCKAEWSLTHSPVGSTCP